MARDDEPRLRRFLRNVAGGVTRRLEGRGDDQVVGPGMRIALLDRVTAVHYTRHAGPIRTALGLEPSRWYGRLVLTAVEADVHLGRLLARELPDLLARVAPEHRVEYAALVYGVLRTRPEAAAVVARSSTDLVGTMDPETVRRFVARGVHVHVHGDSEDRARSFLRRESTAGKRMAAALERGLSLDEVRRVLLHYARAHCGRDVGLHPAPEGSAAYTDGVNLFLPARVAEFGDELDFLVYRVSAALTAGYLEFGSLDLDLEEVDGPWVPARPGETELERLYRSFELHTLARDLFRAVEDQRIEGRIRQLYPGLARDLDRLRAEREPPELESLAPVDQLVAVLACAHWLPLQGLSLHEPVSAALPALRARVGQVLADDPEVDAVAALVPELYQAAAAMLQRVDPDAPTEPYRGLDADLSGGELRAEAMPGAARALEEESRRRSRRGEGTLRELREILKKQPDKPPEDASYDEMIAWLERLPPVGGALVEESSEEEEEREESGPAEVSDEGEALEAQAREHLYPEWDHRIDDYKPDWVRLSERRVEAEDQEFAREVRAEYGPLIQRLRRRFEALRPDAARPRRFLVDGNQIDIDAAIASRVERRAGGPGSERIYARRFPVVRDVAVAFLVDLSSSTNEVANAEGKRIIQVEKEALVCTAEALDALGDRFAVFGFSGYGREQVAFYVAKDFHEALDDTTRARVGALSWKLENRDGAAIRHATARLLEQPARVRILFLLSDGRPLDCGCDLYYDRYAQEDTRHALQEARAKGVHAHCLTVDPRAHDYLESMYGRGAYLIVDRVESLPEKLPALYKRLVT